MFLLYAADAILPHANTHNGDENNSIPNRIVISV